MNFIGQYQLRETGFQMAPMVDIVFLMLCFFVATQVFSTWETEINIKLPTAQTGRVPERLPGEIIINVLHDGRVVVNRQDVTDEKALAALLERLTEYFPGQPVLIRADKAVAYEHVVRVLDRCRQAEIWNISFATTASKD